LQVGLRSIELDKLVDAMTAFYDNEEHRKAVAPSEARTQSYQTRFSQF
jgi:hypothetical protein